MKFCHNLRVINSIKFDKKNAEFRATKINTVNDSADSEHVPKTSVASTF